MDVSTVTSNFAGTPGWQAPRSFKDFHVHMVGVGGSGMSSVAAVLVRRGAHVSGSDRCQTAVLDHLRDLGVRIVESAGVCGDGEQRADLVVASAAIPPDHETLAQSRRDGIPVIKYARLLGELMRRRDGIAVSGTHGKSTTSAWLAFVLRRAGLDPTFVIGAHVEQLGGSGAAGDGPHFVAEACEFDRSFLNLRPRSAAILNIEEDHLDCYGDLAAIVDSFGQFAAALPSDGLLVFNGHDPNCTTVADQLDVGHESFGLDPEHDWAATELSLEAGCYEFTLTRRRETFGRVRIGIPGRHNVLNALAVCALAARAGVKRDALLDALPLFTGARRRMQVLGREHGVTIADDYAHHPTEIRATLEAARERFAPRRVWCVFQPHQHSRTRRLLAEFASSFTLADHVVLPKIYRVRDTDDECVGICAADLVERINAQSGGAEYHAEFGEIVDSLAENVKDGDLVMTMGAGDVWKIGNDLVQRLRSDRPH